MLVYFVSMDVARATLVTVLYFTKSPCLFMLYIKANVSRDDSYWFCSSRPFYILLFLEFHEFLNFAF